MTGYEIRNMTRAELDFAVDLAAGEGWNPGLHDAECFYAADPQGFYLGLLDGEPVSTISVVRYEGGYGFLGFYIVKPGLRGNGYGLDLFTRAIRELDGRDVGLDGVLDQESNYAKWGFRTAHRNIRFEGLAGGAPGGDEDGRIVPLSLVPFEELSAFDRRVFSAPRPAFLRCWTGRPGHIALGVLEGGVPAGYTVLRPCRRGYKFGPLFADDAEKAERLFRAGCARLPAGTPVFLDVPAPNEAGVDLARRYGLEPVFETARMYRTATKPEIEHPLEKWFGVTSFELG